MSNIEKMAAEILRQGKRHKIDDFDSEINWLVRCIADGRDAVKAARDRDAEPVEDIGTQEREGFWSQPIEKYTNSCPTRAPGAEPVTDRDAPAYLRSEPERRAWAIGANAQPQPAQQGSVPEGYAKEKLAGALRQFRHNDDNTGSIDKPEKGFVFGYDKKIVDELVGLLSATVPQSEWWVECSDRMPKEYGRTVIAEDGTGRVVPVVMHHNGECKYFVELNTNDEVRAIRWRGLPAGLKRPQPPAQGGEGDEH